jgi:lysophospholipase L1-like esterase
VKQSTSFFKSFAIVVCSALAFLFFKEILPKRLFPETTVSAKNVVIDSLLLEAVSEVPSEELIIDTLSNSKIVYKETQGVTFPSEVYEDYKGFQYLVSFYEKLFALENQQEGSVRIAYYGDSMTDGDMIVKDLRANMQQQFGGEGVGFVPVTSESAASRATLKHEFSNNWKTVSYLNVKRPLKPFGINGHVFFTPDTLKPTWVKFKANEIKNLTKLNNPTLFYGSSTNKHGKIIIRNGQDSIVKKLVPNHSLNTLTLGSNEVKSLKIDFLKTDSIPIYGFNFDDGKGVHVDNFSNRGNSGLPISTFNTGLMQEFHKKLDYDLIILHYGTNVLNYGSYNYDWYQKKMTSVVNHLKECFPGVSILVVSTADKATKYDLEMKTDSAVVPLIQAQKKYALQTHSGFFNLYTLMGGDGSMIKWVEEEPAMAGKDYTHFNHRGAKKVADMLYSQIKEGYERYKSLRKSTEVPVIKRKIDSTITQTTTVNAQ